MIPQHFKNLGDDFEIAGLIPRAFQPLLVVAAASKDIGAEADRHQYLSAVPAYLNRLPNNVELAIETVAMDAASVLGIAGFAQDAKSLSSAQQKLADAEAEVAQAEANRGKRLSAIYRHEREIEDLTRNLQSWDIDFDAQVAEAERIILTFHGVQSIEGQFDRIHRNEVLKRLSPSATADLTARIQRAKADLGLLTETPKPAKSRQ